jgi:hypothetical protein
VLEFSCVIRKRPEVTVRKTPKGAVLVDLTTGRCWQLNRIGADFLSQLEAEMSLADACETLGSRYDVARDVLQGDLNRLAEDLLNAGLIERVGR